MIKHLTWNLGLTFFSNEKIWLAITIIIISFFYGWEVRLFLWSPNFGTYSFTTQNNFKISRCQREMWKHYVFKIVLPYTLNRNNYYHALAGELLKVFSWAVLSNFSSFAFRIYYYCISQHWQKHILMDILHRFTSIAEVKWCQQKWLALPDFFSSVS